MCRIIKFTLILLAICLGLTLGLITLAQEASVSKEIKLDERVSAEDLEIEEPRLLPDNPFYFLKNWGRGIRSFFTFDPIKKAELKERFANEKLIEVKKLIERGKDPRFIRKGIENYQNEIEKIKKAADKIKGKAETNEKVNKFLDKFTRHQFLHQKILQKLEKQVPEEVFEKIKEARERHLERFGEVMTKLEAKKEKIRERLERNLEKIKGSKYKNFKNLEILKELEEKAPEETKEAIRKTQENALKRLQENLEKMSPEDQEKFKEYIDKISGDKEKHLEILENLKFELREGLEEKTEEGRARFKERVMEARERVLKKIQEKRCPEIEKPAPGFCSEGRIVVEKDEKGCPIEFKCVIPAEIEIPSLPEPPEKPFDCIALWDPVCGENGKTYSNACYAKAAGVTIAYKGECKEKECQTDADCPQPKCGPLRTIKAKCIGVRAKCLEGKCRIVGE